MFRIPLLATKICPVCQTARAYDPRESNAPVGWIHIVYRGADEYVCSVVCQNQVIKARDAWIEKLEKSREEPLMPPDVLIP